MTAPARELRPVPRDPAPSPTLRRAALLLHALERGDREWVIAQLAEADRAQLLPLVAELRTLGIPSDRALVEEALATVEGPRPVVPGPSEAIAALRAAAPEVLASLLRGEPALLVARLLQLAEWPWRDAVLQRLHGARREIEQLLRELEDPPGEALAAALAQALASRLRAPGSTRSAAGSGWLGSWRRRARGERP